MDTRARLLILFALIALSVVFAPAAPAAQAARSSDPNAPPRDLLQFTAGGHVLGFQSTGLYVTNGSRLLRVEFAGTDGVSPIARTPHSGNGGVHALEPVTYPNLWNGITVVFQPVPGGLYKSTYLLAPGATTAAIRLRYNVAAEVNPSGGLTLRLPAGEYEESAPVAWQDIDGARVPVEVAFEALADHEIGFRLGQYNPAYPLVVDPTLQWNTFLGSDASDQATGIAVDGSGNAYVVGYSNATWGFPKRAFSPGDFDAFVAKLSSSGEVQWNTFLGSTVQDIGKGIALDSSGNTYVIGYSKATWGDAPKRPYTNYDAFVAKLDGSGVLQWNTFLGGGSVDEGNGIVVAVSGNIYAAGYSYGNWGTLPPRPYTNNADGFVAKLAGDGTLQWNSFLGGSDYDQVNGIAVDSSGNTYVAGKSYASWGAPRRAFSTNNGNPDAFVARLNSLGFMDWNTFLGSPAQDEGVDIAVDLSGAIYVTGISSDTWGDSPRRPYSAFSDIFVAGLGSTGVLQWNTFLGGSGSDLARAISLDASGNLFVVGDSSGTWGSPLRPYAGTAYSDVAVSKLDGSGTLLWNTFLGSTTYDYGKDSVVDASGNIYVTGNGDAGWGSPIESFHGTTSQDAFVAVLRKENSTTTVTAHTPNPSFPDQTVTISFTVAADPPGSLTPTGSVTVTDSTTSCTATLAVGHCDLIFSTVGAKNLTAIYAGDTDFSSSSSAAQAHQVNKASTTTTITGHTPNPAFPGQTVTISYTVATDPPGGLTPTGSVTVGDGAVSCSDTIAVGHCDLTFATAGAKNLIATFAEDAAFIGSTSTVQAHLVNKANTTISITGHAPVPSVVGQPFTATWAVSVTSPVVGTPTGSVTVGDGSGNTCNAAVAVGQCALASSSPGLKTLTVTYSGDAIFNGSSATVTHEVKNNQYRLFMPLIVK